MLQPARLDMENGLHLMMDLRIYGAFPSLSFISLRGMVLVHKDSFTFLL